MLDINPILLGITLATFIFLVKYLDKVLYTPLLKYMEERDEELLSSRESSNHNISEIQEFKAEAEKVLSEAREKAHSIKESFLSQKKEEIAQKIESKRKELDSQYQVFLENLGQERVSLKNRLLADTSIETALRTRFSSI
jgi:F-type H+-transporting ATPase subunit b